jgi:hypothetical protein
MQRRTREAARGCGCVGSVWGQYQQLMSGKPEAYAARLNDGKHLAAESRKK